VAPRRCSSDWNQSSAAFSDAVPVRCGDRWLYCLTRSYSRFPRALPLLADARVLANAGRAPAPIAATPNAAAPPIKSPRRVGVRSGLSLPVLIRCISPHASGALWGAAFLVARYSLLSPGGYRTLRSLSRLSARSADSRVPRGSRPGLRNREAFRRRGHRCLHPDRKYRKLSGSSRGWWRLSLPWRAGPWRGMARDIGL
jgi:hypothetical protein